MKKESLILCGISILILSCSNPKPKETQNSEVKEVVSETSIDKSAAINYMPIDSDEALLATALLAAPKESRE